MPQLTTGVANIESQSGIDHHAGASEVDFVGNMALSTTMGATVASSILRQMVHLGTRVATRVLSSPGRHCHVQTRHRVLPQY